MCFRPVGTGAWGPLQYPMVRLSMFLLGAGFVSYRVYLRKVLQYLDPSMVVPERVRTMLDTLAEGVLVLDMHERVVLANNAFARAVGQESAELLGMAVSRLDWARLEAAREYPWTKALRDGKTQTGENLTLERQG